MSTPEQSPKTAKIGMVGLGVMGENLALNIERNGYPIAVVNREPEKTDQFMNARAKGKQVIGTKSFEEFVKSIERPRKMILLVKAGDPVDWTINQLKPFLDKGDIIIDGGNSYFLDTQRREKQLKGEGFMFIGSGVSGGEKGALWGPSLMPGGDKDAYNNELRPIWEAIAAKVDDGPCVTYIGPDGAGHFVKMVHNGIEYGDMQLIGEAYDMMRNILGMSADEMADVFDEWNRGHLESFLIEITSKILRVKDPEIGKPLVDLVMDKAGQKGTGKWTSEIALELGIVAPTINAALDARALSARKDERVEASKIIKGPSEKFTGDKKEMTDAIRDALYASKICSYAQGMNLIRAGSQNWNWNINLGETSRIWKGGCIIRAQFLDKIKQAYQRRADLPNLLLDPDFNAYMEESQANWRHAVSTALQLGVPCQAMASSLSYFDMYRTANLPLNLTQAQRDFFGSHTYERTDHPEQGFIHSEWEQMLEKQG